MGREIELTPEAASIDLATALIKRNKAEEAVDILTLILIDNPENRKALDLVATAVDTEPKPSRDKIAEKLKSALSSNPGNAALALLVEKIKTSQM
jgi:predicted Zn-dependent protease